MKTLKSRIIVLVTVLWMSVIAMAAASPFSDMPDDHWAADDVSALAEAGFIHVGSDRMFRGDEKLTRYDLAYMLGALLEKSGNTKSTATYSDIPQSHWAYRNVSLAASYDLMSGYRDGTFRGDKPMTRFEVALALSKIFPQTASQKSAPTFKDIPSAHWAYPAVETLAANGIAKGYGDGTFRGDKNLTRYEGALIFTIVLSKL